MKKLIAEWSFADGVLRFYDALSFFSENKTNVVYELRADGFYSKINESFKRMNWDNSFEPAHDQARFYDDITTDTLVYLKGTYYDNMLISKCSLDNRLMSFFETMFMAFRQKGLILEGRLLDALDKVYNGFKSAWLDDTKAPWTHQGKLVSFKVETLNFDR